VKIKLDFFLNNYKLLYKKNIFPTIELSSFEDFKNEIDKFFLVDIDKTTIYAWEVIIDDLDESYLFDDLLDFLIAHNIGLDFLGHKIISNYYLLKIYQKSKLSEPLATIYNRYLSDDEISNEEFIDFVKTNYSTKAIYWFCSDIYFRPILTESEYSKAYFFCINFSNHINLSNGEVNILKRHLVARNTSSYLLMDKLAKSKRKEVIQGLLYNPKLNIKLLDKIILNSKNVLTHDLLLLKVHLNK
jgi:hypothetical protein